MAVSCSIFTSRSRQTGSKTRTNNHFLGIYLAKKTSVSGSKLAVFTFHFRETNNTRLVYVTMYGKYSIFYDYHKNMVICAHAQTVDTRPLFRGGVWPGYEATEEDDWVRDLSPVYTRPLNRFRNWFNTKLVMCNCTNSVWKPVYVIHLRM